jgi:hypothetical protein
MKSETFATATLSYTAQAPETGVFLTEV